MDPFICVHSIDYLKLDVLKRMEINRLYIRAIFTRRRKNDVYIQNHLGISFGGLLVLVIHPRLVRDDKLSSGHFLDVISPRTRR